MKRLIDFHSHILPNVDDGSSSMEETLGMLRMEAEQGVRRVFATPHFYANRDALEIFLGRRERAWSGLCKATEASPELPAVELGAEVYYFSGMSNSEMLTELTLSGKRYILLEMPKAPWTESMYREIEGICSKQGIIPVIAHIDRYVRPFRTYGIPDRLAELPVLVQANAEFFLRSGTSPMALRMLQADRIHLLGSDCHNLKSRAPNLLAAARVIEKRLGHEVLEKIHSYEDLVLGDGC